MDLFEKTISKELLLKGKIFDIERLEVILPDGKNSTRDIVRHNGAVGILAIKDNGNIILTQQFRKPIDKILIEIPAGKIEKGEDTKVCAFRELEEETGYVSKSMTFLSKIVMAPGFADEYIYLYLAKNLEKGVKGGDEDEFINVLEYSLQEINKMILDGQIYDSKTICAIKIYEEVIKQEKK